MKSIPTLIGSRILAFECIQWLLKYHPLESLKFSMNSINVLMTLWSLRSIKISNRSFGKKICEYFVWLSMFQYIFNVLSWDWQTRRRIHQVYFLSRSTDSRAGGRLCGLDRSRAWCAKWRQTCWASVSLISPCLFFLIQLNILFLVRQLYESQLQIN